MKLKTYSGSSSFLSVVICIDFITRVSEENQCSWGTEWNVGVRQSGLDAPERGSNDIWKRHSMQRVYFPKSLIWGTSSV